MVNQKADPCPGRLVTPISPVHHLGQALADGQPEAGAAVFAGGRAVGLDERLEEMLLGLGGYADAGVGNLEAQTDAAGLFLRGRDGHDHLSLLGELDGVPQQVHQDLAQSHGVAAHQARHGRIDLHDQLQTLAGRHIGVQVDRQLEVLGQVEIDEFEREPARFDFGKVQNVVNDPQQRLAALAKRLGEDRAAPRSARR